MGIWKAIKAAFAPGTSTPPDARRLSAVDEVALSASLRALPVGERGWITLSEARALFSPMDDQYAFGEMDEVGKTSLAAFAAESDHRSAFDLMPVEGRCYFTRKAPCLRVPIAQSYHCKHQRWSAGHPPVAFGRVWQAPRGAPR